MANQKRHIPPPPHLSEFYPYINGSESNSGLPNSSEVIAHNNSSTPRTSVISPTEFDTAYQSLGLQSQMALPTSPQSLPSYAESYHSTTTTPSALDLETLITERDVKYTTECYDRLVASSKKYRKALLQLSSAAGEFGEALEACARLKGSGSASDGLLACGGMQFLIANKQQILVRSLQMEFEEPIARIVDEFSEKHGETQKEFKHAIGEKIHVLKQNERQNALLSRKKYRNIVAYRSSLQQLTAQLDEIDRLKHDYYVDSFEQVQAASALILNRSKSIIELETTIYDSVAEKGDSIGDELSELVDDQLDHTINVAEETKTDATNPVNTANILGPERSTEGNSKPVSEETVASTAKTEEERPAESNVGTSTPNEEQENSRVSVSPSSTDENRGGVASSTSSKSEHDSLMAADTNSAKSGSVVEGEPRVIEKKQGSLTSLEHIGRNSQESFLKKSPELAGNRSSTNLLEDDDPFSLPQASSL